LLYDITQPFVKTRGFLSLVIPQRNLWYVCVCFQQTHALISEVVDINSPIERGYC